jgi:hypothetical protein
MKSLPNIFIQTIPHSDQRYPTVGDWFYSNGGTVLNIYVSKMGNWKYEFLVALHELVEVFICRHQKISQQAVDKFDIAYENARRAGDDSECGDHPKAPYQFAHSIASGVERIVAAVIGVKWKTYEKALSNL